MKQPSFEAQANVQETLSKESLSEKLSSLYEQRGSLFKKASKYYDKGKVFRFEEVSRNFRGSSERINLYFNSIEDGADILDNYAKFKSFKEEKILPLDKEIEELEKKLRIIRNEEREEEEVTRSIEREEQFKKEKDEIINSLYQQLDEIHKQIPEEAQAVGMSAEMAIETYLPELASDARRLEHLIGKVEKSQSPFDFDFQIIKRDLRHM